MFKRISKKLVNDAAKMDIIQSTEIEECIYGINCFFITIINILSAMVIGIVLHILPEMLVFLIVFKFLRKYVGGAHSKTPLRCYITSCITYIAASILIKYYPLTPMFTIISVIVSSVVLYLLCPIEAEKKPLDDIENVVFKRRGRITIIITLLIFFVTYYSMAYTIGNFSIAIAVGIFVVTLFALEGAYHNLKNAIHNEAHSR